jgi:putative peptidoglycan lipid II flippase
VVLASLLAIGAVSRMRYAQTLYVLPVSLFAMSIAATELPELSRQGGASLDALRTRIVAGVRRVSFYVVPSLVAFVLLGNVFVAGIYQSGEFHAADVTVVWLTLMAYSAGLLATTNSRIYQSAFFALRDTKTTSRIATLRIATSALAGAALMLQFEPITIGTFTLPAGMFSDVKAHGLPLGPVGLATGAALGAWLEWLLLRASLARQLGGVGAGFGQLARMFGAALLGAVAGYALARFTGHVHPLLTALLVAGVFGGVYLGAAHVLGVGEARSFLGMLTRRLKS